MTMLKTKTPNWLIERVAQGELEGRELEDVRGRLAAEGRSLDGELDAIRSSNREILTELPRDVMAAAIRRRAEREAAPSKARPWHLASFLAPAVLAGGLALAVFLVRGNPSEGLTPSADEQLSGTEEIGIKGDTLPSPRLLVYRHKPGHTNGIGGSERLPDGARAARGDLLQLAYDKSPEGMYGVLLSIDGSGRVTEHLPEEGAHTSASLIPVREIALPSAYELDDAPGFERFVLVTSTRPFAVAVALDAARALAMHGSSADGLPLPLGPDYRQTSVLLHKIGKGAP